MQSFEDIPQATLDGFAETARCLSGGSGAVLQLGDRRAVAGSEHTVPIARVELRAEDGEELGFLAAFDPDRTELDAAQLNGLASLEPLVRAQVALHRSLVTAQAAGRIQERFWETSLDLLCTCNFEGMFTRLTPRWTSVLGWSEEELMSRPT